ncbi:N-acetyltransferase [Campylobacter sp. MIT 12-8780]|uniref:GNAT family N-acetyltransferase n=1 Tax=Campylobacter sp. MIT 12-8780 TaxID=2202200 RepID=UPI00115E4796|nr:GNAT family N-acetyltransferase [Campylobacter sp. MIT 12-8780]TQR41080.1 N-acetyltransferase [Campylobacter sp. MIT 12-8780]
MGEKIHFNTDKASIVFESKRTYARVLVEDDFKALHEILSDERVMYSWGHGFSEAESKEWLLFQMQCFKLDGFCKFGVFNKKSQVLMGCVGLNYEFIRLENAFKERIVELGYVFSTQFWGQNYAFESTKVCCEYAFNILNLKQIYALISANNTASIKLAKKLGMQEIGKNTLEKNELVFKLEHTKEK